MTGNRKGFTLIELLITTAIIGVLAGIVVLSIGDSGSTAEDAVKKTNMRLVGTVYTQVLSHELHTNTTLPEKKHFCGGDIDRGSTQESIETVEQQMKHILQVVVGETDRSSVGNFGTGVAGYLSDEVTGNIIPEAGCVAAERAWAIWSKLQEEDGYWCIDSYGFTGIRPHRADLGENSISAGKVSCSMLLSTTARSQGGQDPPRDRTPTGR